MAAQHDDNIVDIKAVGIRPGDDPHLVRSELCTDLNTARMFAEAFGPYVRYVSEWGWLYWNGRRWDLDEGPVRQMASEIGGKFRDLAAAYKDPKLAQWLYAWARHVESEHGMTDFQKVARWGDVIHAPVEQFDAHPLKVNCRNCTLDFSDLDPGAEIPRHYSHKTADYLTKVIPHDWILDAPCPKWDAFLATIVPDAELRAFIKAAVGYSILGHQREQVLFVCHGGG